MVEPKFDDYMRPILEVMKDSGLRRNPEIKALVLSHMGLKKEDFKETQKNGNMKYADNINFAISYLFMAGLLDRKARGTYQITQEGLRVINDSSIKDINEKFLRDTYPEFKERINGSQKKKADQGVNTNPDQLTPMEKIEDAEKIIRESVKDELLAAIKSLDPFDFERLCLKFLLALGYGYDASAGDVTKKSGDGGIDGIIFGDKLGLEKIAYQSKLWEGTVGKPEVSQFSSDFDYKQCAKGVFITTSKFSSEAIKFADSKKNLILIDGDKLTDLMYENGIGVQIKNVIKIKDIDSEFFEDLE